MKKKNNNGVFYVAIALCAVVSVFGIAGFTLAGSSFWQEVAQIVGIRIADKVEVPSVENIEIGALPSPEIYSDVNIYGALTTGSTSYIATSSAVTSYTIARSDLAPYSYIDFLNVSNTSDIAWTLPATSTMMSILPEVGSTRSWDIRNATTTAGQSTALLILSAGAGMNLETASGTPNFIIEPGASARLTCTQIYYRSTDDKNIDCKLTQYE